MNSSLRFCKEVKDQYHAPTILLMGGNLIDIGWGARLIPEPVIALTTR